MGSSEEALLEARDEIGCWWGLAEPIRSFLLLLLSACHVARGRHVVVVVVASSVLLVLVQTKEFVRGGGGGAPSDGTAAGPVDVGRRGHGRCGHVNFTYSTSWLRRPRRGFPPLAGTGSRGHLVALLWRGRMAAAPTRGDGERSPPGAGVSSGVGPGHGKGVRGDGAPGGRECVFQSRVWRRMGKRSGGRPLRGCFRRRRRGGGCFCRMGVARSRKGGTRRAKGWLLAAGGPFCHARRRP